MLHLNVGYFSQSRNVETCIMVSYKSWYDYVNYFDCFSALNHYYVRGVKWHVMVEYEAKNFYLYENELLKLFIFAPFSKISVVFEGEWNPTYMKNSRFLLDISIVRGASQKMKLSVKKIQVISYGLLLDFRPNYFFSFFLIHFHFRGAQKQKVILLRTEIPYRKYTK